MIHLKRFGVGLIYGIVVGLLGFLMCKFTIPMLILMGLVFIYVMGMSIVK
jgi:hypothetical protein